MEIAKAEASEISSAAGICAAHLRPDCRPLDHANDCIGSARTVSLGAYFTQREQGLTMGKLVWIASYPKSGNTWMRFFLYAYFSLETREIDEIDINSPEFARMFTQDSQRYWFQDQFDKPWEQVTPQDIAATRMAAQERIAAGRDGLVFVKTHNALLSEYGHPTINSAVSAGAIYIVRNPLDLAASIKNHYGLTSTAKAIRFLNNQVQITKINQTNASSVICSWRRNVESWTGLPRQGFHTIRYEDMLDNPMDTFSGVIRFLGKPLDEGRLRKAVEMTKFDKLRDKERAAGFIEKSSKSQVFFREGASGRWRENLSDWQVAELVRENGKTMERFGYLPN